MDEKSTMVEIMTIPFNTIESLYENQEYLVQIMDGITHSITAQIVNYPLSTELRKQMMSELHLINEKRRTFGHFLDPEDIDQAIDLYLRDSLNAGASYGFLPFGFRDPDEFHWTITSDDKHSYLHVYKTTPIVEPEFDLYTNHFETAKMEQLTLF